MLSNTPTVKLLCADYRIWVLRLFAYAYLKQLKICTFLNIHILSSFILSFLGQKIYNSSIKVNFISSAIYNDTMKQLLLLLILDEKKEKQMLSYFLQSSTFKRS